MKFCPLCQSTKLTSHRVKDGLRIIRCGHCDFRMLDYKTNLLKLQKLYNSPDYFKFWGKLDATNIKNIEQDKKITFSNTLKKIVKYKNKGKLLEIGCASGSFLEEAQNIGFKVYGVECFAKFADLARIKINGNIITGMFEKTSFPRDFFDVVVMYDSLEHVKDPFTVFSKITRILKKDGLLVIATPNTQSLSSRLMGKNWTHYKSEHLFYFSPKNIKLLLAKYNFKSLIIENALKAMSFSYVYYQLHTFPTFIITRLADLLYHILPKSLQTKPIFLSTGEILVIAQKL